MGIGNFFPPVVIFISLNQGEMYEQPDIQTGLVSSRLIPAWNTGEQKVPSCSTPESFPQATKLILAWNTVSKTQNWAVNHKGRGCLGMDSIRLSHWAFQKFCYQILCTREISLKAWVSSSFINYSANLTLVGFGGCWLWISIWPWILIWAMNIVSQIHYLCSWFPGSMLIGAEKWTWYTRFPLGTW